MSIIQAGAKAPEFSLKDQHGKVMELQETRGTKVILSFHPLAFTRVCTKQMQQLEKNRETFDKHNTLAVGISVDSVPCKHAWAKEIKVKHTRLLADFWPHGGVARQFGIFREMDGFSERAVMILDEDGIVRFSKIYPLDMVPDMGEIMEKLGEIGS